VSNVIDSIPEQYREVLINIVGHRDPQLLTALRTGEQPTQPEREAVEEVLADALSEHFGPGHIPTDQGILIERTIEAFLEQWPIETD
jgi:hypothetical protein